MISVLFLEKFVLHHSNMFGHKWRTQHLVPSFPLAGKKPAISGGNKKTDDDDNFDEFLEGMFP
jgi:hypothetical protein